MLRKRTVVEGVFVLLGIAAWACSDPPLEPDPNTPAAGRGGSSSGNGQGGQSSGQGGSQPSNGGGPGSSSGGSGGGSAGGAPAGNGGSSGGAGGGSSSSGVLGHPDPKANYPKRDGFTLKLVEEFADPIDLDKDPIWTWSDGGLPEGAVRFVRDAISFSNGKMILTVRKETANGSDSFAEPVKNGDVGFVPAKTLKSGELRTKLNNFRYGRYEARWKPPTSSGNFISTLFVFRTPKFEDWREIDIELVADKPGTVGTNVIFANNVGAWNASIQEFSTDFPMGNGAQSVPAGFNHQDGAFHTYAFEWLPNRITWFVDDVPVRVKESGGLPIPEKAGKIIMNLWIFATAGGFGGDPTKNTYPMSAEYEWFRFYQWDGDKDYPCASPPGCLPAEDRNKSKNNPNDGLEP